MADINELNKGTKTSAARSYRLPEERTARQILNRGVEGKRRDKPRTRGLQTSSGKRHEITGH